MNIRDQRLCDYCILRPTGHVYRCVYKPCGRTVVEKKPLIFIEVYFCSYIVTPLIRINWDGEPSYYTENPDNWIFH